MEPDFKAGTLDYVIIIGDIVMWATSIFTPCTPVS